MTCLQLVSLIDRNLCFGFTGGVWLVHLCAFRGHNCALTRAQRCPCLGAIVPFLRHFTILAKQEQLLGILFSCFLIIGNVSSGIYIKCMWWVLEKSLQQRKFKIGMRFYPSPFIFSPGMPINTGGLRVKGKNAPFITLHRSSSFLCKRLRVYTLHNWKKQ